MRIAVLASEGAPYCKSGGLGDVMEALPSALARIEGNEVVLVLPYYKKINHLGGLHAGDAGNIEAHRPLNAGQVIVQAGGRVHEQGSGGAHQVQTAAQFKLECLLDEADGALSLI